MLPEINNIYTFVPVLNSQKKKVSKETSDDQCKKKKVGKEQTGKQLEFAKPRVS